MCQCALLHAVWFLVCPDVTVQVLLCTVSVCAGVHSTVYVDVLMCTRVVCTAVCACVELHTQV